MNSCSSSRKRGRARTLSGNGCRNILINPLHHPRSVPTAGAGEVFVRIRTGPPRRASTAPRSGRAAGLTDRTSASASPLVSRLRRSGCRAPSPAAPGAGLRVSGPGRSPPPVSWRTRACSSVDTRRCHHHRRGGRRVVHSPAPDRGTRAATRPDGTGFERGARGTARPSSRPRRCRTGRPGSHGALRLAVVDVPGRAVVVTQMCYDELKEKHTP